MFIAYKAFSRMQSSQKSYEVNVVNIFLGLGLFSIRVSLIFGESSSGDTD